MLNNYKTVQLQFAVFNFAITNKQKNRLIWNLELKKIPWAK